MKFEVNVPVLANAGTTERIFGKNKKSYQCILITEIESLRR